MLELWPRGDVCFQKQPTASSPGEISSLLFLCGAASPRVTASLCPNNSHPRTRMNTHTHIHNPPAPRPTFDHLSQDVYGPLFAVLMIIVTGWFHYPWCSDGCGLPWRPLIRVSLTTGADAMNRGSQRGREGVGGGRGADWHLFLNQYNQCVILLLSRCINTVITIPLSLLSWRKQVVAVTTLIPPTFTRRIVASYSSVLSGLEAEEMMRLLYKNDQRSKRKWSISVITICVCHF